MERSFKKEVDALRLGAGEMFRGEGILAVTKALLQSGVSYVGGYQGAPVSHLLDVMVDAEDLLADLGVHVETCTNEAAAAAMLGASINYPLRGAVTWKSIVGTNVAADALSNLASPGVIGGALIVLGEDYGEGASVIQERSYAYAMKSSIWLLDPRPDLPTIVDMVEKGFELSEASHAPVMLDLRVRACHVTGEFTAKDNKRGAYSGQHRLAGPPRFEYGRLAHPPVIFTQERLKIEERLPAAQKFIREQKLNEVIPGDLDDIGIIVLGGLTNGLLRALARLDLADLYGVSRIPIYVLNVAYPLVPDEVKEFCAGKRAVLVVEEGSPEYVEQQINVVLRGAGHQHPRARQGLSAAQRRLHLRGHVARHRGVPVADASGRHRRRCRRRAGRRNLSRTSPPSMTAVGDIPPRPPNFCTGCPERPVFAAIKLAQREIGPTHISADIGCHSFATFAPFSMGNSILGYGMSLASAAAVGPNMEKRPISIMGDGGFWHNGLITGVASNMFNKGDGVLIVMQNGYASATGQQYLPSSDGQPQRHADRHQHREDGALAGRHMAAHGAHLQRRQNGGDPEGGDAHGRARAQGHHRRRRMHAGAPAPHARRGCREAQARRARGNDALRRRRRNLHRRSFLHPAVGLPVADGQTQSRSAAQRSGGGGDRKLRRLRAVRRGRARRGALPVVLPHRRRQQSELVGPRAVSLAPHRYWLAAAAAHLHRSPQRERGIRGLEPEASCNPLTPTLAPAGRGGSLQPAASTTASAPLTVLIAALGGEGGGVLTDWIVAAAESQSFPVQSTSIPGVAQRTGATTYHIELVPARAAGSGDAAADPRAGARHRRRRSRRRQRADGGRPRHRRRLRHAGPHHDDRLDQPLVSDGGENGDGRWPLRSAAAYRRRSRRIRKQSLLLDLERSRGKAAP